VPNTTAVDIF